MHWLARCLGLDDPSGSIYLFWSGIGSDLGELAIVGGLITLIRSRHCHIHRCWRLAKHTYTINGVQHVLCRHHHPDVPQRLTASQVKPDGSSLR